MKSEYKMSNVEYQMLNAEVENPVLLIDPKLVNLLTCQLVNWSTC
ncbi:hypothetical protein Niako_2826 [Niastella koreensis GR20-10]|uniref:Uncharacterized protein n=1 Tax=Niastella koreensis (strain DSM 17620 / KACC 11465 / NBRC 106392 / GR20-10) TaxID=700598 RepID=G8T9H0_NIAKG|nr:hypothetical protein Niako_2826 [Niastella koreensis GR20-10]